MRDPDGNEMLEIVDDTVSSLNDQDHRHLHEIEIEIEIEATTGGRGIHADARIKCA